VASPGDLHGPARGTGEDVAGWRGPSRLRCEQRCAPPRGGRKRIHLHLRDNELSEQRGRNAGGSWGPLSAPVVWPVRRMRAQRGADGVAVIQLHPPADARHWIVAVLNISCASASASISVQSSRAPRDATRGPRALRPGPRRARCRCCCPAVCRASQGHWQLLRGPLPPGGRRMPVTRLRHRAARRRTCGGGNAAAGLGIMSRKGNSFPV
jgi:hypothetical protein